MSDTYSEILPCYQWMADELEDAEVLYWSYKNGKQFNVKDSCGFIHSYYTTTGTAVLHGDNRKTAVLKNKSFYNFLELISDPEEIKTIILKGERI